MESNQTGARARRRLVIVVFFEAPQLKVEKSMQFIDLKKQYSLIEEKVLAGIKTVLDHGQYIMGPEIDTLESQLAAFVGVKHAIVNASGTDALLMALLALDIKAGDEVITSPFSFFATAEVIALLNATPVFVDIDPDTYNIDAKRIEAAISDKTKAIIPVSLYGQCADMDAINTIARKYAIPVIEDAAQSFGATHHGTLSCGLSDIGCTSFFPSKPLGGYGDSGACFTNNDVLAERLRQIRIHGQDKRYSHARIGINGRMDSIQAAILLEKLTLFPEEIALRQAVAQRYDSMFANSVKTPILLKGNTSVYAQYTIEVEQRDAFQREMNAFGVPTSVHYPKPMHHQAALSTREYSDINLMKACHASNKVVSLPMHPYLTEKEQEKVVAAVHASLHRLTVEREAV